MFPFEINIDFSWIELASHSIFYLMWYFFIHGGWILFLLVGVYGFFLIYMYRIQGKFAGKQTYVYLAIDIPKQNMQSPKAVENMFATLAGAHTPIEFHEKYFKGEFQLAFSFEIVSIEGHVQYVIRTPIHWRELVEASVYSQYPDAEITEVEDYTQAVNIKFPSDEYNLWGCDIDLYAPDYLPIRTYVEFEHSLSQEIKDPMAAILEVMNSIGSGEQLWFQIIAGPADLGWEQKGIKRIDQLMGKKGAMKKNILDHVSDVPLKTLSAVSEHVLGSPPAEQPKDDSKQMFFLPPLEDAEVKMIQHKVSKIGYDAKCRLIYLGKKEVFRKGLGVSGGYGAWKQFNIIGGNGFKPGKNKTKAILFKKLRLPILQNRILEVFKDRNPMTSKGPYALNIEELASLYHFPYLEVKAPLLKKVDSKKASAPVGLPVETEPAPTVPEPEDVETIHELSSTEKIPIIDYDDDYFESRFAKDKTRETDRKRKEDIMKKLKQQK